MPQRRNSHFSVKRTEEALSRSLRSFFSLPQPAAPAAVAALFPLLTVLVPPRLCPLPLPEAVRRPADLEPGPHLLQLVVGQTPAGEDIAAVVLVIQQHHLAAHHQLGGVPPVDVGGFLPHGELPPSTSMR